MLDFDVMGCCFLCLVVALSPWMTIGSVGFRNFVLCKKPEAEKTSDDENSPSKAIAKSVSIPRKGSGSWKSWFNKSLSLKISSH